MSVSGNPDYPIKSAWTTVCFCLRKKNVCLPTQIAKTCKQLSFFSILTLPIRWSEQCSIYFHRSTTHYTYLPFASAWWQNDLHGGTIYTVEHVHWYIWLVYVKTDVTSAVDLDLECRLNYRYTRSRGRRMRVFSVFICLQFLHFLNRSHQHQCTETPRNKVCTPGKFSEFTMKWSKSRTPWDFPGQFKPYRKMQQKNTTFLTNSDKKKIDEQSFMSHL